MKIGMIDYYLDEWHANNYPKMIRELSDGKAEIGLAWAKKIQRMDFPMPHGARHMVFQLQIRLRR